MTWRCVDNACCATGKIDRTEDARKRGDHRDHHRRPAPHTDKDSVRLIVCTFPPILVFPQHVHAGVQRSKARLDRSYPLVAFFKPDHSLTRIAHVGVKRRETVSNLLKNFEFQAAAILALALRHHTV